MALARPPAPASGAFPSPPPPFSRCPLRAVPRLALRSRPRGARLRPLDPRGRPTWDPPPPPRRALGCFSRSLPPPGSLSPRVPVFVSVALPVCSLPSSTPARSLPLSLSRSGSLSVSLSPSHSCCGPRALGPRPPSPAPRPRPARPGARAPAARGAPRTPNSRHPLRFARLSPLLTRDPRPTAEAAPPTLPAPEPRAARGARPCPFPLRLTGHHTLVPNARRPGPSPGWGAARSAPARDPARVFLLAPGALLPEPIPSVRSRVFSPPSPPQGQVERVPPCSEGTVGGRGSVPGSVAPGRPPLRPLPLLKDGQLRTLHTPLLSTEVWPC